MYSARTPGGSSYRFGTSGLLYRSNKLMYDRATFSLWSNLTGEPVLGRLAASPVRLEMRPVTLTTWADWHKRHPDTTVVKLDPSYGARWRFDYSPGAADKAREGVDFPVWLKSGLLDGKEEVLGLSLDGAAKAYPLNRLLQEGVVNDSVGGVAVVLVGERASQTVRAYRRRDRRLARRSDSELLDEAGRVWRIEEAALVPAPAPKGETEGAPRAEEPLPRLPGHVAYWFAWFAFHPETEVHGAGVVTPETPPP